MTINGQLEIDDKRGVIYFHQNDEEFSREVIEYGFPPTVTVLRVCNLPQFPFLRSKGFIDINHMHCVNYEKSSSWRLF